MNKDRELLKKGLDILTLEGYRHTIPEIKDLIAQPEQEPVVGMYRDIFEDYKNLINTFDFRVNEEIL